MASIWPMRSPSRSIMVAPCQLRTVSMLGMLCSLLVVLGVYGRWRRGGASRGQRRPAIRVLAATRAGALSAVGVEEIGRAGALGGWVVGGLAVAVARAGLGGRALGLLAQLGAALLGLAGRALPVP